MARYPSRQQRHAFTLIELLVVVSIIIVLIALSAVAIIRFGRLGPSHATIASMSKIKSTLDGQWAEVTRKAQDTATGGQGNPVAKLNAVNRQLDQAFPTSLTEVLAINAGTPNNQPYLNYLQSFGLVPGATSGVPNTDVSSIPPEVQSAICLMMILERGPANRAVTPDQLGSSGALTGQFTVTVATASGTQPVTLTLPYCVDAWGNPLRFGRVASSATSPRTYLIQSIGADQKAGTADDIFSNNL